MRPDISVALEHPENRLTDYDRQHYADYLRLLDADRDEARNDEIARIIFGFPADEAGSRKAAAVVAPVG